MRFLARRRHARALRAANRAYREAVGRKQSITPAWVWVAVLKRGQRT